MPTHMNELGLLLLQWANFYLITSAAAATLTGLLFVVMTLAAERRMDAVEAKIRVYLTPTVVYFASVLGVAVLLTFPNHTQLTATFCVCAVGIIGLAYSGSILIGGDKKSYIDRGDVVLHAVFPFAAYGLLAWGGVLLLHDTQRGLTFVAIGILSLLTIAIRNLWAIAIWVVSARPGRH